MLFSFPCALWLGFPFGNNQASDCTKCPPGKYLVSKCTSKKDTTCEPCQKNEYSSEWNEDSQCTLQPICDPGRGLMELHPGNRTSQRVCICKEGYYFDDIGICMETAKCGPGFGARLPAQQNKDTICEPCPEGYFSNTTSREACALWTNCTGRGLQERKAGTHLSDAHCERSDGSADNTVQIWIAIIVGTIVVVLIVVLLVLLCNNLASVKEKFRRWGGNILTRTQDKEKTSFSKICSNSNVSNSVATTGCGTNYKPIQNNHDQENHVSADSPKETANLLCRSDPTEDEYTDGHPVVCTENECVHSGSESMSDIEESLGINGLTNDAQGKCFSYSQQCQNDQFHTCGQGSRQCFMNHRDISESTTTESLASVCSRCSSQYTCGTYSSQRTNSTPLSDFGEEADVHATKRRCPRSQKSSPESSPTSELPPPSGNVTGDNNTTVISTGPIMNITAEVVYLVVSSQDQPTTTESNNMEMGSPVEEETQGQRDNLVVNTEPQPGRYTDFQPSTEWNSAPDSSVRTDIPASSNLQQRADFPTQETGIAKCDETSPFEKECD
uniref:TNF receptor superfamily member 11a n=1 Tax=Leptobrachium leishanense TaxID=445787 RepID=A0A8C5MY04_9ANUR